MSEKNKATLLAANAQISQGNHEGFLASCSDDIAWATVGGPTLQGKQAVRQWMSTAYAQPPKYTVTQLLADGDFVIAMGDIMVQDADGIEVPHAYCDVWRFRDGKMAELRAFVIRAAPP